MKRILFTLLVTFGIKAWAQEFEEEPAKPQQTVKDEDLKALKDARALKSEEAIVRASAKILGVDSQNLQALNTLGVFYAETGKLGLARIVLNRALQSHPNEPALHNNLGTVYLAEGKLRQAITAFRKSLDLKSGYRVGAMNLGSIFLEYKDYARALAPLEAGYKSLSSDLKSSTPHALDVAANYALTLSGVGRAEDAAKVYEAILPHIGNQPQILLNYAILLVEKVKKYDVASKIISKIRFGVEDQKILKRIDELEKLMGAAQK